MTTSSTSNADSLFVPGFLDRKTDRRFAVAKGEERQSWQVEQVWELHHEITRRIFAGQKNTFIASALGCTPQQVSNVRNSAIVQEQLRSMQIAATQDIVDVKRIIGDLAVKAIGVLEEVMNDAGVQPSARIAAAKDLLDRGGHAPVQQVQVAHGHFTADDLREIKERAARTIANSSIVSDDDDSANSDSQLIELKP